METKLGELYKKLAQSISVMIPVKWDHLYYLGEVEKDKLSWSSVFYFAEISNRSKYIMSHDIPQRYSVSKAVYKDLLTELDCSLLNIYDCFNQYEHELWEQVSFSLKNNGEFNIDFKYDVMNAQNGSQFKREIIWAYETFGYTPTGRYSENILNEYIANK